jgi:hypothetical protein
MKFISGDFSLQWEFPGRSMRNNHRGQNRPVCLLIYLHSYHPPYLHVKIRQWILGSHNQYSKNTVHKILNPLSYQGFVWQTEDEVSRAC